MHDKNNSPDELNNIPDLLVTPMPEKSKKSQKTGKFKKVLVLRIALIVIPLIIGIASVISFIIINKPSYTNSVANDSAKTEPEIPQPKLVPSPLTGTMVSEEIASRPTTCIMIENSPDARPQSGLLQAGIVYEALAEGGISRFLTLFQDTSPDYIGPVRSVRPYYVDWASGYDCGIAHAGGSTEALAKIRQNDVKDLDQFTHDQAYWRTTDRYAPHNLYTSFEKLDKLNQELGFTTSKYQSWSRKEETAEPKTEQATSTSTDATPTQTPSTLLNQTIDLQLSGFEYNPKFVYNQKTNSYDRFQAGEEHIDEKTSQQISPKNVVVIVIPNQSVGDGSGHILYNTIGGGNMYAFIDGKTTTGTWSKKSMFEGIILTTNLGENLKLNPGQTWVTVITSEDDISY